MKKLKVILNRIIGSILALIVIYFVGPSIKSFYSHHQVIALLVPYCLIGLGIYASMKGTNNTNNSEGEEGENNL
ncbi:hypothetical protein [Desulfosporosinus metallidurans]|uniref:hypothetical protein n=1 Tax=Desulfosporosinus metallidurans TaxID=1888891 RepID=UPI00094D28FC|nr:hypothetical protein [Desulfosporosinus metallidurans]